MINPVEPAGEIHSNMNRCLAIPDRISCFHVCRKSHTEDSVLRLQCLQSGDPRATFRTQEENKTSNDSAYGTLKLVLTSLFQSVHKVTESSESICTTRPHKIPNQRPCCVQSWHKNFPDVIHKLKDPNRSCKESRRVPFQRDGARRRKRARQGYRRGSRRQG